MNRQFYIICILSYLIFFSCDNKTAGEDKENEYINEFCPENSNPLDIIHRDDTLNIIMQSSECGEWGGHKEQLKLIRNENRKLYIRFIVDTVSCDFLSSPDWNKESAEKSRVVVLDTSKYLKSIDEKIISIFLQRLLELQLRHEIHDHFGNSFEVYNTRKTLHLSYWNSSNCKNTYYGHLRKHLFGDLRWLSKKYNIHGGYRYYSLKEETNNGPKLDK